MRGYIKSIALECIQQHFPNCSVAFLAGSSIHKKRTEHSDIDILIIDETVEKPYHQCTVFADQPIELFVFNRDSLFFMFEISRMDGIPTIPRMCAEGWILKDDGTAQILQQQAFEWIQEGPARLNENKDLQLRYHITDLLLDFDSSITKEEKLFTAHELFDSICKYVLKANGYWQGNGKWMYRSLQNYNQEMTNKLIQEYVDYIQTGDSESFLTCIDNILNEYGGRVLTGYKDFI